LIIQTRLFGEIEIEDEKILTFPSGLVGMKKLKRFIILDTEKDKPFRWFQSLEDPHTAFLTIEPRLFRPNYRVAVQKNELAQLGIAKETEILILCIVTLYKEPKTLTANLQGPLLINAENRMGKQVIITENHYNSRHDILKELGEAGKCGESVQSGAAQEVLEIRNSK
jgi:flagellar assembly factor FliW